MGDEPSPSFDDQFPLARPIDDVIPVARPLLAIPAGAAGPPVPELLLVGASRPTIWVDLAICIGGLLLIDLVAGICIMLATGSVPGLADDANDEAMLDFARIAMVPMIILRCAGAILVIAVILAIRRQSVRSVGMTRRGFMLNIPIGVGAMVVAFWLTILTLNMLALVWPSIMQEMEENAEWITRAIPNLHPLGFAGLTLLIGFYEELVFRGFLMTRLRRALGSWILAVLVSTVVFTALHAMDQTWPALIAVSILSVVFSVVTIWRRSLVPAIVGHALFNLFQFLWLRSQMGESWT